MAAHDSTARARIREDLGTTLLVEAGAGSGKTRSIIERMLALLKEGRCTIASLSAVTFTRKAAAEMRERFQIELEKAVREECPDGGHGRLSAALDNLEQCSIETIHAFCARLLRERPIEIGLDPDFREMDEIEDAAFRRECWGAWMNRARLEREDLIGDLHEVGLAPEDLEDAFADVCGQPDVVVMPGSPNPPDFTLIRARYEEYLEDACRALPPRRPEKGYDDLQKTLIRALLRHRNIGFDSIPVLISALEGMDREGRVTQNRWSSREAALSGKEEFDRFRDNVVRPFLRAVREYRHDLILNWLRPAVVDYRKRRREVGLMNFTDLLLQSAELLRGSPAVRRYFADRITHILVDEFQDTDPVQAEVLFLLTGADPSEPDWKRIDPRPGSLFLVGDPKQSIYRFRRADMDTYHFVKRRVRESGGEVLGLTDNFRSLPGLGVWVNRVFSRVFPPEGDRFQAEFAPMTTRRKPGGEAWSGIRRLTIPLVERNTESAAAALEAAAIADWISWACAGNVSLDDSPVRPGDILLLFRYKKNMALFARALEERGIPFEVTGSAAFSNSDEVREIVNLARALNDPDDPIRTVAVLRGLFFGISDAELYRHKKAGGDFSHPTSSGPDGSDGTSRVRDALGKLSRWREWTRSDPATVVIEKILEQTGIVAYLAGKEMGESRAGNCLKLLEVLRTREREDRMSFSALTIFLEKLMSEYDVEEMSLFPGRSDAVRLMNLHKSKGLESPIVFLANPFGMRSREPERHIRRYDGESRDGSDEESAAAQGFMLFSVRDRFRRRPISQPVDWEARAAEESRYLQAEEERLLYVAATRARNLLIVSRYPRLKAEKRAWGGLDDHLDDQAELEIPGSLPPVLRKTIDLNPEVLGDAREAIARAIREAGTAGYLRETVTSLAKAEGIPPYRDMTGRGLAWGRMVHSVLESLGRRPEADRALLVTNALSAEGWDPADGHRLYHLIDRIRSSELWARAMRAERRFVELPFSLLSDEASLGRVPADPGGGAPGGKGQAPRPTVLTGVIDLVFKEADGWVIADYKTDEIGKPESYLAYYAPQVRLYARFWEEISGDVVKECGLFFTAESVWLPVERG